ncbi:tetratricopeptide repeat-containing response regulator [Hydrocarboniclastica marina]|uniref:Tetratricopeptide repeat protein n=1 Tax=Hydrocarboniclastica marina TaxID=2259620 RepID=A0A4P7XJ76_9ALTE|nr:tetratricopeptide repeat-containing response regulator [Hydrocarboniclastica marina]QCF26402.1 tetratricopeptide repeat protein [Hydrocarboniclastica marina]
MTDSSFSSERVFPKLKFLVVDDFENFRNSLKAMLRSFGADKIETAQNGKEAVYRCTYERFDVVLCDYNMGEGKNGQQVLEELRHKKLLKHTSVFALVTAETSRDIVMSAREYQPDTYITKPLTRATLEKRLESLLEQQEALYPVNAALDAEDLGAAIERCNELLPKQPRFRPWLQRTLADLYYRTGGYSEAHQVYESALSGRGSPNWAKLGQGKVLVAEQKWDEAIAQFEALIEKNPDYVEAYDWLAKAQQEKGQLRRAQKTLETALKISPKAIVRQQHLAEVSTKNQDLEAAAMAWRNTVRLSENSVHEAPTHHLNLGRCLSDLSEGDSSEEGRKRAGEALQVLQQMQRRYREDSRAELAGTLIAARVHAGQGDIRESRQLMEQARTSIDPDTVDAETGLELARTLFTLEDTEAAQSLLRTLAGRFEDSPGTIADIESLLDEPVSMGKKLQARAANREGIAAFEAGDTDKAAEAFGRALELVPQHPALNLNLVQILLKAAGGSPGGVDAGTLQRCTASLNRIAHLPPQHRQYKRYLSLQKKVAALTASKKASS